MFDSPTKDLLAPTAPLTSLRGVGQATAAHLAAAGIATIADLLWFFPTRAKDVAVCAAPSLEQAGRVVRFACEVRAVSLRFLPGRRSLLTVQVAAADGTRCDVMFFNQPYLKHTFAVGSARVAEGLLRLRGKRLVLAPAQLEARAEPDAAPLRLVYPEVDGVSAARLNKLRAAALAQVDLAQWPPPVVPALLEAEFAYGDALRAMHEPRDAGEHERARRYFALLEAVRVCQAVEAARRRRARGQAVPVRFSPALEARLAARIPLRWTGDQTAAIATLRQALARAVPMGLLLQGDVGTGKTAVAMFAALAAIASDLQVAFLAPTELLAEQHYAKVGQWLEGSRVRAVLLTGSLTKRERGELAEQVAAGDAQLVFGTHALLSPSTQFARLGLVVIDEQHRFGVEQRQTLVRKGLHPHLLVLSATPIPRTLTLAMFGDLDVAVLRDKPLGVRPALARQLARGGWRRVHQLIARRARRGQGTFVVCPRVGEAGEDGGAVATCAALRRHFACGLVHGRLPVAERQAVLQQFRAGAFAVLVGTTVLEVGVDVPHATLMVVCEADRFGLATLHQLRGRVGRAGKRGLCVLLGTANERTQALCRTTDGFAIAELDLALRGSGEILGLRQSGRGELRALDPGQDLELLLRARQAVAALPGGADSAAD